MKGSKLSMQYVDMMFTVIGQILTKRRTLHSISISLQSNLIHGDEDFAYMSASRLKTPL